MIGVTRSQSANVFVAVVHIPGLGKPANVASRWLEGECLTEPLQWAEHYVPDSKIRTLKVRNTALRLAQHWLQFRALKESAGISTFL
jgi:hypothetical protein